MDQGGGSGRCGGLSQISIPKRQDHYGTVDHASYETFVANAQMQLPFLMVLVDKEANGSCMLAQNKLAKADGFEVL